jgi:SAM-dependent methyltransferase
MTRDSAKGFFEYKSYRIPVRLIELTGGGVDTWDVISRGHMEQYARYAPIAPDSAVLEVGCGVGRDAIQLAEHLSEQGSYVGIDIIQPSIEWCQANIAARHPNFQFHYLDVRSQMYNRSGSVAVRGVTLPVESESMDRIILQSVFTHMFFDDIVHYLREFRRILRPEGRVVASYFIMDEGARQRIESGAGSPSPNLTFKHEYGPGCWVNDKYYPQGAVAYTFEQLERMLRLSGMMLDQPVHRGHWSGLAGMPDGQDMVVFRVDPDNAGSTVGPAEAYVTGRQRWRLPRITVGWR